MKSGGGLGSCRIASAVCIVFTIVERFPLICGPPRPPLRRRWGDTLDLCHWREILGSIRVASGNCRSGPPNTSVAAVSSRPRVFRRWGHRGYNDVYPPRQTATCPQFLHSFSPRKRRAVTLTELPRQKARLTSASGNARRGSMKLSPVLKERFNLQSHTYSPYSIPWWRMGSQ